MSSSSPVLLCRTQANSSHFNSAKCLDPVLTNIPNVSAPSVEHLDLSDHALVLSGIVINDYNNKLSPKLKSKRLWRVSTLANPVDLETAIDHHMENLTSSGMNNMWLEWRDKFLASADEIAPRVFYSSRKKKSRCPWMTPELLHLIHKHKNLHRKVVLSCHQNREALLQHRKLRNIVNNLYRQLRNAYFQDCLNQYRKSPRKLWSAINHVTGRQRQSLPVSDNIIPDITDHFRLLYVDSVNSCELPFGPTAQSSFTESKPVHASEVKRLLKDLIPNKAPGPDDISPLELKLASGKIAATVAALFNESLSSGTLPEQFKMANLHPLLKPGKTDIPCQPTIVVYPSPASFPSYWKKLFATKSQHL